MNQIENNFAYITYLDKKEYLPGLYGLYCSLLMVQTQYPLIIFYSGDITKNDIEYYIKEKNIQLIKLSNYIFPTQLWDQKYDLKNTENYFNGTIYCHWQTSNIIGPLLSFGLLKYKKICYLHCDMIIYKNIDYLFKIFKTYDLYITGTKDNKYVTDSFIMYITPNQKIFNYLIKNIHNFLLDNNIINIDSFINNYLINYIIIKEIKNIKYIEQEHFFHSGGPLKYWTVFPHMDIKKILSHNNLNKKKFFDFIKQKIYMIKNDSFYELFNKSIWKNNLFFQKLLKEERYEK